MNVTDVFVTPARAEIFLLRSLPRFCFRFRFRFRFAVAEILLRLGFAFAVAGRGL
ncbi:hypothetical protein ACFQ4Q_08115 [Lysobacter gummosus]|uniref:hypothetical protein n=1 Tax=Lysobacter gummosus TaxID=262324 RepID=UPI0036458FD3